jgi:hypothetical protein
MLKQAREYLEHGTVPRGHKLDEARAYLCDEWGSSSCGMGGKTTCPRCGGKITTRQYLAHVREHIYALGGAG